MCVVAIRLAHVLLVPFRNVISVERFIYDFKKFACEYFSNSQC